MPINIIKAPDEELPALSLNSLDDLDNETFSITVKRAGRRPLRVQFKPLSWLQWMKFNWEYPDPAPTSIREYAPGGIPVYDYSDPEFLRKAGEMGARRGYARLIASLTFTVPGNNLDEQIDNLEQKLDYSTVNALFNFINGMVNSTKAAIDHLADTFPDRGTGYPEDDGAVQDDRTGVLETPGTQATEASGL